MSRKRNVSSSLKSYWNMLAAVKLTNYSIQKYTMWHWNCWSKVKSRQILAARGRTKSWSQVPGVSMLIRITTKGLPQNISRWRFSNQYATGIHESWTTLESLTTIKVHETSLMDFQETFGTFKIKTRRAFFLLGVNIGML